MESIAGTYVQNQVQNDMVEIRFTRPVAVKEHRRYAIRLCSQGAKTCFGDSGVSSLRGPCGVTFSFYPCDLSFNGTTPNRGQLPCILYYSSPRRKDGHTGKIIGEIHARDIALQIVREITMESVKILRHVRDLIECGYYRDKSQNSAMIHGHCVDSEHNITPIEEHLDVSCVNRGDYIAEGSSMSLAKRELQKKFESFTKGLVDTLKAKSNPFECEIATDIVATGHNGNTVDGVVDVGGLGRLEEVNQNELSYEGHICGKYMNLNGQPTEEDDDVVDDEEEEADNEEAGDSSHLNTLHLLEIFNKNEATMFHTLLPTVLALVAPLVNSDPKSTVQILALIRDIIPHVASLNQHKILGERVSCNESAESPNNVPDQLGEDDLLNENQPNEITGGKENSEDKGAAGQQYLAVPTTSSNHYCVVESDHPYKSASILTFRVDFPPCVQWFTVEFDAQSGTIQPEDYLNVSIPTHSLILTGQSKRAMDCEPEKNGHVEIATSAYSMAEGNGEKSTPTDQGANLRRDDEIGDWIVIKKFNRYGFYQHIYEYKIIFIC